MKVHLMFPHDDFNIVEIQHIIKNTTYNDLELELISETAARKDRVIYDSFSSALLHPVDRPEIVKYRQENIKDSIKNSEIIRNLYDIACDAVDKKRKSWWGFYRDTPSTLVLNSVTLLNMHIEIIKDLRIIAQRHVDLFSSAGFKNLFSIFIEELDDDYLNSLQKCLNELKFDNGMNIAAKLGNFNQGADYFLIEPSEIKKRKWYSYHKKHSFVINERDDAGHADLYRRRELALMSVVVPVYRSALHVHNFFASLQRELAFYVGSINLYETLTEKGRKICFPNIADGGNNNFTFKNLMDMSMCLTEKSHIVGNTLDLTGKNAVIITGANQGGKTTFLRSIGEAQIMLCAGIFVTADEYNSTLTKGVYSHFKKEEDKSMESGKLVEEMKRMSEIVDLIKPGSVILLNESFSSTNERDGSEIGRQIISAFLDKQIKVFCVTHFYELSHGFYKNNDPEYIFLIAERMEDGERTFSLAEGEPAKTSHGIDIYRRIFKEETL